MGRLVADQLLGKPDVVSLVARGAKFPNQIRTTSDEELPTYFATTISNTLQRNIIGM